MPATVTGIHLGPDTLANRPAANAAGQPIGALYSCTNGLIYLTDGSTWVTYATLGGTDTDEKAKVSSNDTTAGYLNGKLVAGTNITLTENNNGGNETLTIAASGGGGGAPTDATYLVATANATLSAEKVVDPGIYAAFLAGPTITNAEDDHFAGNSLDAKWLSYTGFDATPSFGLIDSWVEITDGAKLQAVPAGDWTIACEVLHGDHESSGYSSAGLILTNGTAAGASTDYRFAIGAENSLVNWRIVLDKFVNNAYISTPTSFTGQDGGHHRRFLRVTKSGTTYGFWVSDNRFVWTLIRTGTIDITPTHVGIFSDLSGTPTNGSLFNWFVRT